MSDLKIHNINMLYLLWFLPLVVGMFVYAARKRQAALLTYLGPQMLRRTPIRLNTVGRRWRIILFLLALTLVIVALARPAWNRKDLVIKRSGRDVVFLLDVSKSMLAEDLSPNRLEHAKLAIMDTVGGLQGDRVGLVVFAGNTVVKCPLTLDYGFFMMGLEGVDINSVSRGGTMIGDALRTTLGEVFDDQARQYKDIILITDGEDHESFPVEAAKAAAEKGVRLIIIGLGDEAEGKRIPIIDKQGRKNFLRYNGREVWTKLDAGTLRQMAKTTPGGRYLPVATGNINLGEVYQDLIAGAEKKELETRTRYKYEEKFQFFLASALLLLLAEMLVGSHNKKRKLGDNEVA